MSKRPGPLWTRAADLLAELARDPEYKARRALEDEARREREKELAEDERLIVADLRRVGVTADSVWDLVNRRGPYAPAIPVLLRHLEERHDTRTLEGVIRALAVVEARGLAAPTLLKLFRDQATADELRWVIGQTLTVVASDSVIAEIAGLMADRRFGEGRALLPQALLRAGGPEVLPYLLESLADETLCPGAVQALAEMNATEAVGALEQLRTHKSRDVRDAARSALKRLRKSARPGKP